MKKNSHDSALSFFPSLTTQIDQKILLYFSNAFSLFEGVYLKKKVFVIELNYLTVEMVKKINNVSQFQNNTLKYIPDDKNLVRIGYFYNINESLFTIIYEKGNMTPWILPKDSSTLQRYQYFYSLLTIVSSFHNKGYSLGLIHPGLIFFDESIKMYTLDNMFYAIIPLIDKKENIQLMSYFGYFQSNIYEQIISSYESNNTNDSLFLKTDIIMLCVIFKFLFSKKSYDAILCECEVYMNTQNSRFHIENEPGLTQFFDDMATNDYNKISTIKQMIQTFSQIFTKETQKANPNLAAFACIKCGIKHNTYSTFHKCEEKKGKKKRDLKTKEQLDSLDEQIGNMPHLKTVSLYNQYSQKEDLLYKEIELLQNDIVILISNEEKKFNIIMDYAQNMFKEIEKEKRRVLNDKIKQFEEIIQKLTDDFVAKIKKARNISIMSYKMSKKRDSVIQLESESLYSYITTLDNQKKELKDSEKEYEEFVKNSQKIFGHPNYEAKLEDLMNKIKEEYMRFINVTIDYLYEFQEKIEENNEVLKKDLEMYNKMKSKQEKYENKKAQEAKEKEEAKELEELGDLLKKEN